MKRYRGTAKEHKARATRYAKSLHTAIKDARAALKRNSCVRAGEALLTAERMYGYYSADRSWAEHRPAVHATGLATVRETFYAKCLIKSHM